MRDRRAQAVDLEHGAPVECGKRDGLAERGPAGEKGQPLRRQVHRQPTRPLPRPDAVRQIRHPKVRRVAIKDLAGVPVFLPQPAPGHAEIADQVHALQFRIPGEHPAEHDLVPSSPHERPGVQFPKRDIDPPTAIGGSDRLPVEGHVQATGRFHDQGDGASGANGHVEAKAQGKGRANARPGDAVVRIQHVHRFAPVALLTDPHLRRIQRQRVGAAQRQAPAIAQRDLGRGALGGQLDSSRRLVAVKDEQAGAGRRKVEHGLGDTALLPAGQRADLAGGRVPGLQPPRAAQLHRRDAAPVEIGVGQKVAIGFTHAPVVGPDRRSARHADVKRQQLVEHTGESIQIDHLSRFRQHGPVGWPPVDPRGARLQRQHRAAGGRELVEQPDRIGGQRHARRHDHHPVCHLPHDQPRPGPVHRHARLARRARLHQRLVPQVQVPVCPQQRQQQLIQRPVEPVDGIGHVGPVANPGAADGMDHQHVDHALALAECIAQPGKVIGDQAVLGPPGLLVEDVLRIVALALAAHAVEREVGVVQVDAQDVGPVADPLPPGVGEILARAAIVLAQRPALAELAHHAIQLFDRQDGTSGGVDLPPQFVDAGDVHVGVVGHRSADPLDLASQRVLGHVMAGVGQAAVLAPRVHLPRIAFDKALGDRAPVIVAHAVELTGVEKERGQTGQQVVAVARSKIVREAIGPGNDRLPPGLAKTVQAAWLVSENARDGTSEILAE